MLKKQQLIKLLKGEKNERNSIKAFASSEKFAIKLKFFSKKETVSAKYSIIAIPFLQQNATLQYNTRQF